MTTEACTNRCQILQRLDTVVYQFILHRLTSRRLTIKYSFRQQRAGGCIEDERPMVISSIIPSKSPAKDGLKKTRQERPGRFVQPASLHCTGQNYSEATPQAGRPSYRDSHKERTEILICEYREAVPPPFQALSSFFVNLHRSRLWNMQLDRQILVEGTGMPRQTYTLHSLLKDEISLY